jgi:hypothetical protein
VRSPSADGWSAAIIFLRNFVFSQSGDRPYEDVEKVANIPRKLWPQLLLTICEVQQFSHPFLFLATDEKKRMFF